MAWIGRRVRRLSDRRLELCCRLSCLIDNVVVELIILRSQNYIMHDLTFGLSKTYSIGYYLMVYWWGRCSCGSCPRNSSKNPNITRYCKSKMVEREAVKQAFWYPKIPFWAQSQRHFEMVEIRDDCSSGYHSLDSPAVEGKADHLVTKC